jgi:hypothetical protein
MRKVVERRVEDVQVQSILAGDVSDKNGSILLKADAILTKDILKKISELGIASIFVYTEETESPEQLEAKRVEIQQQTEHRFRHMSDNRLMMDLKRIILEHRLSD